MGKTVCADGQFITSAWGSTVYGTGAGGGHRHDGVDADGHCGKINLNAATDVTGLLPAANMAFESASIPVTTVGLASEIGNKTISYVKLGSMVVIAIPDLTGAGTSDDGYSITGSFSAIAPAAGTLVPCISMRAGLWLSGYLRFTDTQIFVAFDHEDVTGLKENATGTSGIRGLPAQSLAFMQG